MMTDILRISLARAVLNWRFTSPLLLTAVADNGEDLDLVLKIFREENEKLKSCEDTTLRSDVGAVIEVSSRILRGEALADSVGRLLAWCAGDLPEEEPEVALLDFVEEIRQARRISLMKEGL